jgi:ribosome recycling factor
MDESFFKDIEQQMKNAVKAVGHELAMVRTGRANSALLDRIVVEAYGAQMPLNQVATVGVTDPTTIMIRPFDKNNLGAIEKAIMKSDIGLIPQSDGQIIRLNIPPLTRERRQEMVKMIKGMVEEGKVQLRNIRRDYIDKVRKDEKSGKVSEDNAHDAQERIQELTDSGTEELDKLFEKKEEEIISI